jgi:hypothetical protein
LIGKDTVASDVKHCAVFPDPQLVPEKASMTPLWSM